jgi:ferrochelatase
MGSRRGVVLLNLGGPERLEEVRPFLYNLFSDPAILRIPSRGLRKALAWVIAATREKKSQGYYAKIGGGSPLRRITEAQAEALERRLASGAAAARVYVGMRCSAPTVDDALDAAARDRVEELVALPLFPQFSTTTSGSALDHLRERVAVRGLRLSLHEIREWYADTAYVEALADTVRAEVAGLAGADGGEVHLLYSAHSVPQRFVDDGDPYLEQTRATVAAVNRALDWKGPWTLAFQSKVGPVKWLEPLASDVIAGLGRGGVRRLVVVPVSFVSDHIETLYELDILYRDVARAAGIDDYRRAAALNVAPAFIEALAGLVERELGAGSTARRAEA